MTLILRGRYTASCFGKSVASSGRGWLLGKCEKPFDYEFFKGQIKFLMVLKSDNILYTNYNGGG